MEPVRDWSDDSEDNQEQNAAFVKPYVYRWMLREHVNFGNFRHGWMIDPAQGIEEIAFFCSSSIGEYEDWVMLNFHKLGDDEASTHARIMAKSLINVVWMAITELIHDGLVEVHLEFGWPSLRLTTWSSELEEILEWPDDRARAERMRARTEQLKRMPYAEYLQSPEWRYRRELHLEAAGNRCQLCNSPEQPLHVHHRTYVNRGRERFYDLVVLCGPCHEAFHRTGRRIR